MSQLIVIHCCLFLIMSLFAGKVGIGEFGMDFVGYLSMKSMFLKLASLDSH